MKNSMMLLLLFLSSVSQAQVRQRSTTEGLNVAASVHVLGWTSEYFQYMDENAGSGFGGGIRVGYGITQLFEPYIAADFTGMGISNVDAKSFGMTHIDAGLRLNFAGTISAVRPFVEGGYSFRKGAIKKVIAGAEYADIDFKGGTPHVGGGLNYFPKVPFSLFARGVFTIGKKSTVVYNGEDTDEKADVTTFRISVGVSFSITELTK